MGQRGLGLLLSVFLLPACGGGGGGGGGRGAGVPAGLPAHLAIGLGNFDVAWMASSGVAWGYRSQYISSGVNTPGGWTTWNSPPGAFATLYMNASAANGLVPVFNYYQIRASTPNAGNENPTTKLQSPATMNAYYADFKLLMQKCQDFGKTVIVHIEPDFWGFCQSSSGGNPASVPVCVASSGHADAAGLPNTLPGFAQALVRIRNAVAPKCLLAMHASHWGAGADLILNNADPDVQAAMTAAFFNALGADYDLMFHDPSDRDAGYRQFVLGDGGASWWDNADYDRYRQYLAKMWQLTGRRNLLWQVPIGNTVMKTCNNSDYHYQDNHAEYWLKSGNRPHLVDYAAAGVIGIIFGNPQDKTTGYTDAAGDGVTNGGATGTTSTLPDDDGGFLRLSADAYYDSGAVSLP